METIFVYGTLREGHANHEIYLSDVEKETDGITKGDLYTSGVPVATPGSGIIKGEVYNIDQNRLERIDALEGHPACYRRRLKPIVTSEKDIINAWIYMIDQYHTGDIDPLWHGDYNLDTNAFTESENTQ